MGNRASEKQTFYSKHSVRFMLGMWVRKPPFRRSWKDYIFTCVIDYPGLWPRSIDSAFGANSRKRSSRRATLSESGLRRFSHSGAAMKASDYGDGKEQRFCKYSLMDSGGNVVFSSCVIQNRRRVKK